MKSLIKRILTTCLFFFALACEKDDPIAVQRGQLTFSFTHMEDGAPAGGKTKSEPVPAFVSYTIAKQNGETISEKLELFAFNESYVTSPKTLIPGTYQLKQFLILDASGNVIYATPLAGSDLAPFVEKPLPFEFQITTDETTHVVPEVLAVEDLDPVDFGYVTFGFEIKSLTVVRLPEIPETITEVDYVLTHEETTIHGTGTVTNSMLDLNRPELTGKTWTLRIYAWVPSHPQSCFPEVYHYRGQVTFRGKIIRLPSLQNRSWAHLFYYEKEFDGNTFKVFRAVDPRINYRVLVQFPAMSQWPYFSGFADRLTWIPAGNNGYCDAQYEQFTDALKLDGTWTLETNLSDLQEESCIYPDNIDSFIIINFFTSVTMENKETFEDYFVWMIKDDGSTDNCPGQTSGGRARSLTRPDQTKSTAPVILGK